ncbi:MAG: hypothetical protein HC789_12315 [Microcoleus sp. CSU_2_2]|nr:hypothetical protein [Microcoleus sp. SU_5_3]NJS11094.1 hypothetical protein [Microcoleus sp. CSU_2_2]
MISDITTTLNMLRQEAAAIGITEEEAKKYGNIRHRRTWSLAIEHHLSRQGEVDRKKPPLTPHHPNSSDPNPQASGKIGESRKPEVELTANLCESQLKIENQATSSSEMLAAPQQQVKQPVRSYSKSAQRIDRTRGFQQVVQNHIKALKTASATRTNSPYSQLSNWVCPECAPDGENGCHLCAGEGNVSDIAAIGWTLAYMEMLGCSAKEIEPLRRLWHDSSILEVNLKVCVAIKKSTEVLARTEKWIIGNG